MRPLLAHIYEPHRVTYPCYVQPKLNGIRALYQNGNFQSRDLLPFPDGLLDHLSKPLMQVFGPEVILDGELYVHGWSLQKINAAVTPVRLQPTEDTVKVEFHIFDQVDFVNSFITRYLPRTRQILGPPIFWVDTWRVDTVQEADERYALHVANGYEGQMYRLGDCPYTVPKQPCDSQRRLADAACGTTVRTKFLSDKDNRCWHLLKRKDWQDDEFICVGVQEGEGKLSGMLGAVKCECNYTNADKIPGTGIDIFSVGSGLSDSERQHYWSNPPIGRLVKVKYLCLSDAGIPLNPTILCIL